MQDTPAVTPEVPGDGPSVRKTPDPPVRAHFSRRLRRWNSLGADDRKAILSQLFFEGDERRPYISRFAILMVLSVVLSSLGLIGDSAAVVIGAMLIAPLMTPILALAASIVMGWGRRLLSAFALVLGGTIGGVGTAWLIAFIVPDERLAILPHELLSRTQPALLDLVVGLAAGAAAAYVTVRTKSGAALPGAAVAVALVPPLAATGVLLNHGGTPLARNAFLLFLTNLAAIVLAAILVFLASGFHPHPLEENGPHRWRRRLGLIAATVAVIAVALPLAARTTGLIREGQLKSAIAADVRKWASARDLSLSESIIGDEAGGTTAVTIDLMGSSRDTPPLKPLITALEESFGHSVHLTVRTTERRTQTG